MKRLIRNLILMVAAAGLLSAAPVTFTGTSGSLSASATFDTDASGHLIILLENRATAMTLNPAMLLTAVYFDIAGANPVLIPQFAMMGVGATVACAPYPACAGTLPTGGDVSAEWAYSTAAGMPREFGISSTGLGLFGPGDNFGPGNLFGPLDVDGMQYGLASSNYNPLAAGVAGGLKHEPVVVSTVIFTLSGYSGFTPSQIQRVLFQYGTSLTEPQVPGDPQNPPTPPEVPEPATMAAMGSGLVALALLRFRRRK